MCRRFPKWHKFKSSMTRLYPSYRPNKKSDVQATPTSKKKISGKREFKGPNHAEEIIPILKPPTTGARKGRKKLDGKSNHSTSSTAAETETSSRNREVKIRLSMAEEEVISPSPTEKRQARFQRPSLEQRQKLLAIAHDITNVLDTYSKEYSDSEKSSKYSSRLMELLGRASHKSPRTSDEQVQTKLKAIEERIVQVEKEILQMSQQTKPKQAKPHRSKGLTAKRTGKSKSGSSDKNISSSPNLYPTIIECSVEQSSVTMNGFKSLKSYRVQQQSSLSKYDTVAEAANPQKNRSTNDLADVLKSAVSKTKKGRVSPLNKILTRLKAVSKPPAKACLLKAEMPAAKQVVADTSDEPKSKPLIVLVTEEISTRRQTEKTPIKSQQPLPSQKKAPSGLPSLKKDHLPIVISSEKGSSFPKSTDVSKTRSPKQKFVEKLSPLAAEKSALEGMQYSPTDVSPTPRNMDSDKEQDGDAEEPLSSPTSDDESHDIKTPRRERA